MWEAELWLYGMHQKFESVQEMDFVDYVTSFGSHVRQQHETIMQYIWICYGLQFRNFAYFEWR
jgi:hypothetical protein